MFVLAQPNLCDLASHSLFDMIFYIAPGRGYPEDRSTDTLRYMFAAKDLVQLYVCD